MKKLKTVWDYHQPEFYHFSEDSIWLAEHASKIITGKYDVQILDICAGCGVVGMEILSKLSQPIQIDSVELQSDFKYFYIKNKNLLGDISEKIKFINLDFRHIPKDIKFKKKYDLVVSNPPYFKVESTRQGPNDQTNICRFFIQGTIDEFLSAIVWSTKKGGKALFLVRKINFEHILNYFKLIGNMLKLEVLDKKSDTLLVLMFMVNENGS